MSRGRALLEIQVDVYDEHGTHALAATLNGSSRDARKA